MSIYNIENGGYWKRPKTGTKTYTFYFYHYGWSCTGNIYSCPPGTNAAIYGYIEDFNTIVNSNLQDVTSILSVKTEAVDVNDAGYGKYKGTVTVPANCPIGTYYLRYVQGGGLQCLSVG